MAENVYKNYLDFPLKDWKWPNFSPREMASKGDGKLLIDPPSMDKLQALRKKVGVPLIVVSAYRSPEHNARVGGAKGSYHMQAKAFDISMTNHDPEMFERAARAVGFTGFGFYPRQNFMHVDTGPARSWGDPFPLKTATRLPEEAPTGETDRTSLAQSTTIQATAVQVATGAGGAVAAVGSLDGTAQIVALVCVGIIMLAALWIARERLKKWAQGVR